MKNVSKFSRFSRLNPQPAARGARASQLVADTFHAYNASRLREGCELITRKMLPRDGLVGFSLTGALVPAGLGKSCLIPLIKAGFIDWIVTTGANLYHDIHYGLGMKLYRASPFLEDVELRKRRIIRIYDIVFDYSVLLDTDAFICQVIRGPEFQRCMGTDEFHYLLGKYVHQCERKLGLKHTSLISVAYQYGVPCFSSSPGDSSIGMNVAAMSLAGCQLQFDVNRDVNQSTGIVYDAKQSGRTSSVVILGGGSPKNFMLQTEPQIQEVLGLDEKGHDYYLQITDARPDTGGLSGATPSEAVSWGKVNPARLPDAVVCYADSTIALPLITAYALDNFEPRNPKRLIDQRDRILDRVARDYEKSPLYKKFFEE
jgi:deoxyhypusine synthase